jgi:hypothetical protein
MVEILYATPKFDAYHRFIYCPSPRNYGLKKAHVLTKMQTQHKQKYMKVS